MSSDNSAGPTFWDSPAVITRLTDMVTAEPAMSHKPSEQMRKLLRAKLIALNSADSAPASKDRDALHGVLFKVVKLVRIWKQEMAARSGPQFWDQAEQMFAKDGRMLAWLEFIHRIAVSHTQDAVEGLVDLGKAGFCWSIPGGRTKSERQPDYGFDFIHLVTHRIEGHLARLPSDGTLERPMGPTSGPAKQKEHVTIKPAGTRFRVFFRDEEGKLIGDQTKTVLFLFSENPNRIVDYPTIWDPGADIATRRTQLHAAIGTLAPGAFAPFPN